MKKLMSLFLVMVMTASLSACGSSSSGSSSDSSTASGSDSAAAGTTDTADGNQYDKVNLTLAHGVSETTTMGQAVIYLKSILEERSNGAVTVDIYPNQQLGGDREYTEACTQGNVSMAMPSTTPVASFVPEFYVFDSPWIFNDRDAVYAALDSEAGQNMLPYLESANLKGLGYFENGLRHMTSSKEINSMEDLKGLKIRVMENDVQLAFWKAEGTNPTPMAFGEVYTALQQKTVDAQENPMELIYTNKFYEVQPYVYLTGHIYTAYVLEMNLQLWNSLNTATQDLIQTCVNEAIQKNRDLAVAAEQECIDAINASGVSQCIEVSDELKQQMAQACKDAGVYDKVRELAGDEVTDAFYAAIGFEG